MKKNIIPNYSVSRAITLNPTWLYMATDNEHCMEVMQRYLVILLLVIK